MARISKWIPADDIPENLYVHKIVYGFGGLRIYLKESPISRILQIEFKPYLGLRIFDESYRLKTIADNDIFTATDDPWTLFVSYQDEIIEWLKNETFDIIDSTRDIKNYMIVTLDEIIDVISEVPPTIKWLSENEH